MKISEVVARSKYLLELPLENPTASQIMRCPYLCQLLFSVTWTTNIALQNSKPIFVGFSDHIHHLNELRYRQLKCFQIFFFEGLLVEKQFFINISFKLSMKKIQHLQKSGQQSKTYNCEQVSHLSQTEFFYSLYNNKMSLVESVTVAIRPACQGTASH